MAALTYHPGHAGFVWTGRPLEADERAGELAGWTRTLAAPGGAVRMYTADYQQNPMFNPWAALALWRDADEAARTVLEPYWRRYESSFALAGPEDVAPMPPGEALLPFQRAGVRYALDRRCTLLADPMGLGKSVQAIGVVNALVARRVLVVCPANVLVQWRSMLRRWVVPLGAQPDQVFIVSGAGYGVHPRARFVCVSYDRAWRNINPGLVREKWDVVILDEAHYLRNHTTARTRGVLGAWDEKRAAKWPGVVGSAGRVLALTGTPLPNRPRECYTLGRALDWEALGFMSEDNFKGRFSPSTTVWRMVGKNFCPLVLEKVGRLPELQARLRCNFMVRRNKEEAAPQLPAKCYTIVEVSSRETERISREERLLDINTDVLEDFPVEVRGHIAALRHEMGLAMVPLVVDYLKMLCEETREDNEPFVVFAHHREVIARLAERLGCLHPVVVTGSTSPTQRVAAAQRFATDPRCRLFIGQLMAAGTGLDGLQTRGSRCVFAEASWVPGENEQCVDRVHRIGQTRAVQADFLVAEGSLNARIIGRAVEKLRVSHAALDARPAR